MAALSSMGSRRPPGAIPRSVQKHHQIARLLEERLAKAARQSQDFKGNLTARVASLSVSGGGTSELDDDYLEYLSKNQLDPFATSNSTYGDSLPPQYRLDRDTIMSTRIEKGIDVDALPSETTEGLEVARPLTLRRPRMASTGAEDELYEDPEDQEIDALSNFGYSTSPSKEDMAGSTAQLEAPKGRYAREKKLNWEWNVEAARNGLAVPTKCNGYGQALSKAAKVAGFTHTDKEKKSTFNLSFTGVPLEVTNPPAAPPKPKPVSRLARWRPNPVLETFDTSETIEHATYKPPQHNPTKTYSGPKTGYTSGFSRNKPTLTLADPPAVNALHTLDDIHPSVVNKFKIRDPVEYQSILHPDSWATTYKQTIGASADITMNNIG